MIHKTWNSYFRVWWQPTGSHYADSWGLDLHLPDNAFYAFLEDEIDRFAKAAGAKQVASFISATKTYPVYVIERKGEEICLAQAPVGSAPAANSWIGWIGCMGEGRSYRQVAVASWWT